MKKNIFLLWSRVDSNKNFEEGCQRMCFGVIRGSHSLPVGSGNAPESYFPTAIKKKTKKKEKRKATSRYHVGLFLCARRAVQNIKMLKDFVKERLLAAADEIFGMFERTIASYEEQLCRARDETERHRRQLEAVCKTQIVIRMEGLFTTFPLQHPRRFLSQSGF